MLGQPRSLLLVFMVVLLLIEGYWVFWRYAPKEVAPVEVNGEIRENMVEESSKEVALKNKIQFLERQLEVMKFKLKAKEEGGDVDSDGDIGEIDLSDDSKELDKVDDKEVQIEADEDNGGGNTKGDNEGDTTGDEVDKGDTLRGDEKEPQESGEIFPPPRVPVKEKLMKGKMDNKTKVLHLVSHSHWDREWYLPFEKFRRSLVQILDDLWEIFKNDETFYHFHADGQMAVIEDYLEIRPYRADYIIEAAKKKLISLGPWYTQPDEFLVSGESLIRNLLLGIQMAEKYGEPSLIGYLPDTFGHISQLPQILNGFNISISLIGRGVAHTGPGFPSEAYWYSPDNSKVFVVYLASWYCNALFHHRMSDKHNDTEVTKWFNIKLTKVLEEHSVIQQALLLNGCDHTGVDYDAGIVAEKADKLMTLQNVRVVHSSIDEFTQMAKEEFDNYIESSESYTKYNGELFAGPDVTADLVNVRSTKITQKQANWRVQTLTEQYSEPLSAISWLYFNTKYDRDTFLYLWKLLLQNHAHDSISGCSVAEVHNDVDNRLARALQISESLLAESMAHLVSKIDIGTNHSLPKVLVFNPSSQMRKKELVTVQIDFPIPHKNLKQTLQILDHNNEVLPSVILYHSYDFEDWDFVLPNKGFRKGYRPGRRIVLAFLANDIPALGYSTYSINLESDKPSQEEEIDGNLIQNDLWLAEIMQSDGSIKMRRKLDGKSISHVNILNFCYDSGTEYISIPTVCDIVDTSSEKFKFSVSKAKRNDVYESISAVIEYVPMKLKVNVLYVLLHDANHVDVRITLENQRQDFRLQSTFPFKKNSNIILGSQFNTLNITVFKSPYRSHSNFFGSYNPESQIGYMVATRGTEELEVSWERQIGLSLLRSITNLGDWGVWHVPTGQEKGFHAFEFRVIPFFGESVGSYYSLSEATKEASFFNHPSVAVQILDYPTRGPLSTPFLSFEKSVNYYINNELPTNIHKGGGFTEGDGSAFYPQNPRLNQLPPRFSFVSLEPEELVLSAVKVAEKRDSLIVRFYNPTLREVQGRIALGDKLISGGFLVNMNEDRLFPLDPRDGSIFVTVKSKKVITLELQIQ